MDNFCEQILKKKKGALEWAIIVGTLLLALALAFLAFLFSGLIPGMFIIVLAGIAYGAWWLITTQNVEFEYCVTNGDIDVDQITARRKRKRLVSVAGRKIQSLQPYDPAAPLGQYQRRVMAAESLNEDGLWCFTYHSKKNGNTFVVFHPDMRVLKALYGGLPKLVQMDTARAARAAGIDLKTPDDDE